MINNSFCVIGGDLRQLYCAKAISNDGYSVCISCFEECRFSLPFDMLDFKTAIRKSEIVILPLPITKNGTTLNAPFSKNSITLDDSFAKICSGKYVFCGMNENLLSTSSLWNSSMVLITLKEKNLLL